MNKTVLRKVLFSLLLIAPAMAWTAPPGAVPVFCSGFSQQTAERTLSCRRADTRAFVTPVPDGMFLHITDIVVNPNNVATSGLYSIVVGVDDGTEFPGAPNVELLGEAADSYHFSTSYIVLGPGDALAVRTQSNSILTVMDIRASGYLANQASP